MGLERNHPYFSALRLPMFRECPSSLSKTESVSDFANRDSPSSPRPILKIFNFFWREDWKGGDWIAALYLPLVALHSDYTSLLIRLCCLGFFGSFLSLSYFQTSRLFQIFLRSIYRLFKGRRIALYPIEHTVYFNPLGSELFVTIILYDVYTPLCSRSSLSHLWMSAHRQDAD